MGRYSQYLRLTGLACVLSLACINPSYANCKVTLVATLDNQPALLPAQWNIFRIDNPYQPLRTLSRHSGTIDLPAGQYTVTVELNQHRKKAAFRVESEQSILVKVAMD